MIADWTVEAGAESPVIEVPWPGWVDLLAHPERTAELPEVQAWPELAEVLRLLNETGLQTSKVDVFPVTREEVDPELAEVGLAQTAHGLGSYVDCRRGAAGFAECERAARAAVRQLHAMDLEHAVAEVVIRPARLYDEPAFGWSLYAVGFGADGAEARAVWAAAARAIAEVFAGCTSAGE